MSVEIFISTYRDEETHKFPATEIRKRFGPVIIGQRWGLWHLGFEERGSFAEIPIPHEDFVEGFIVKRPPGNLEFWEIIAGFLKDLGCVLYWPGGGAVMASLDLLPHLPKGFVETMGIPWVTTDPERIRQYVGKKP